MLEFNKRSFRFNVPLVSGSIKLTEPPEPEKEFIDIVDLLKTLDSTDKVALILRHSERDDIPEQHELTLAGRTYALGLGQRMKHFIENDSQLTIYSSTAQRCGQTAQLISDGLNCINMIAMEDLISSCPYQITAPSSGWEDYSLYAYDLPVQHGAVFKDKATITTQLLEFFKARMDTRLNLFITHDQLLEILVVDVMNKNIDLRFFNGSGKWITYLAGLAIVEHQNGTYEYFPVKGLDRGWQPGYSNVYIPDSVTIGGRSYPTTIIGNQIWTTENLDWKFDGLIVGQEGISSEEPRGNYYDNDESTYGVTGNKYGLLYNFPAVESLNGGLLPDAWKIASREDFNLLEYFVGEYPGTKLKANRDWNEGGTGTDDFRFCALPTGYYYITFDEIENSCGYWSSTIVTGNTHAYYRNIELNYSFSDQTCVKQIQQSLRPMKTLKHYQ